MSAWHFIAFVIFYVAASGASAQTVGTSFTYQGRLEDGAQPANGSYDLQFTLFDAPTAGNPVAAPFCADNVNVQDGLFTVSLDFGILAFNGDARWLQIDVRADSTVRNCGTGTFTPLTPRQPLTATPYALKVPGLDGHSLDAADGSPIDALFVDANGRVGIGTSAPTNQLTIHGGLTLQDVNDEDVSFSTSNFFINNSDTQAPAYHYMSDPERHDFFTGPLAMTIVGGNVAIGAATPRARLHVQAPGTAITALATAAGGVTYGGQFESASASGRGVLGRANAASASTIGVHGESTAGRGVFGQALASSGVNYGVYGSVNSPDGYAGYFAGGRNHFQGSVGVGTLSPAVKLHVTGGTDASQSDGGYLQLGSSTSTNLALDNNEIMGRTVTAGFPAPSDIFMQRDGGTVIVGDPADVAHHLLVESETTGFTATEPGCAAFRLNHEDPNHPNLHRIVDFYWNDARAGSILIDADSVTYSGFTGVHYAWTDVSLKAGALVVMTGANRPRNGQSGGEPVYGIAPSRAANSPNCLGAYSALETSVGEPADFIHLVAAVGNGTLLVTDNGGGAIDPGDYLISSDVPGCAMKDDPQRFPVGHIIAQAAERLDWSTITADAAGVRRARLNVHFERFDRHGDAIALAAELNSLRAAHEAQQRELDDLRDQVRELTALAQRLGAHRAGE